MRTICDKVFIPCDAKDATKFVYDPDIDKTVALKEHSNVIVLSEEELIDLIRDSIIEQAISDKGLNVKEFLKQKGLSPKT